jgi:AbrB family looped-hinge helix DNA binding protein
LLLGVFHRLVQPLARQQLECQQLSRCNGVAAITAAANHAHRCVWCLPFQMGAAILIGMNIHVDKLGRIVIPKRLRDRLGLQTAAGLELQENADGFSLRVPQARPNMVKVDGLWVHQGAPPSGFNWDTAIDAARQERHPTPDRL